MSAVQTKITPIGSKIVVERIEEEAKTKGGIVLPDTAKEKTQRGKVIAVGQGRWDDEGKNRIPVDVKEGDIVFFTKYGGTELEIDGSEYIILDGERDILAVLS